MGGLDCRRFIEFHKEIPRNGTEATEERGWDSEAGDFVKRHSEVIAPLETVGHRTRAVRALIEGEADELTMACAEFGRAWWARYPRRKQMAVKGCIV